MRINETTVLVGRKCVLVPYRKEHVEKYHEWMKDPRLQEQTASEPLTLEEEYEMQSSWHKDPDKLTFIVLERRTNQESLPTSIEEIHADCSMAGDVNLFLNQVGIENEEEEEEEEEHEPESSLGTRLEAECEVMIAEPSSRRKGIAKEALSLLINYASNQKSSNSEPSLPIDLDNFVAKISLDNTASRALFRDLSFKEGKIREVWKEVEVRLKAENADEILKSKPLTILEWKLES